MPLSSREVWLTGARKGGSLLVYVDFWQQWGGTLSWGWLTAPTSAQSFKGKHEKQLLSVALPFCLELYQKRFYASKTPWLTRLCSWDNLVLTPWKHATKSLHRSQMRRRLTVVFGRATVDLNWALILEDYILQSKLYLRILALEFDTSEPA